HPPLSTLFPYTTLFRSFGADGQAVRRILDVAAGDHGAVGGFERGAHLEVRESCVGVLARAARGGDEVDLSRPPAPPARSQPAIRSEEHTSELQSRGHLV